jgi:hypothetical protein
MFKMEDSGELRIAFTIIIALNLKFRVSDQWVEGQCYWETYSLEIFCDIRNYATKLYFWTLRTSALCGQMRQDLALWGG